MPNGIRLMIEIDRGSSRKWGNSLWANRALNTGSSPTLKTLKTKGILIQQSGQKLIVSVELLSLEPFEVEEKARELTEFVCKSIKMEEE